MPTEQGEALRPLFCRFGMTSPQMPGDGVGEGLETTCRLSARNVPAEGMCRLKGAEEVRSAEHPLVVIFGMLPRGALGGSKKAADALREELALGQTVAVARSPAAGGIDGDKARVDFVAAPASQFGHAVGLPAGQEDPTFESHGVKTFPSPSHINPDHPVLCSLLEHGDSLAPWPGKVKCAQGKVWGKGRFTLPLGRRAGAITMEESARWQAGQ